MNLKLIAVLIALPLLVASCTDLAKKVIDAPKVKLEDVEVTDMGATGATLLFSLLVTNTNNFPLKVDSIKYELDIGEKRMGGGRLDKGARVAANSKETIKIPVPVKYTDAITSVASLVVHGKSKYRIQGAAAFGPLSIPFDKTGDIELGKNKK